MRKLYAIILALSVAACATAAVTVPTCPPLVEYTAEEQERALAELKTLPPEAMLRRFVNDYGKLRAQCRALTN